MKFESNELRNYFCGEEIVMHEIILSANQNNM